MKHRHSWRFVDDNVWECACGACMKQVSAPPLKVIVEGTKAELHVILKALGKAVTE